MGKKAKIQKNGRMYEMIIRIMEDGQYQVSEALCDELNKIDNRIFQKRVKDEDIPLYMR